MRLVGLTSRLIAATLIAGCAHAPLNERLLQCRLDQGYYFRNRTTNNNSDEVLFLVAFSGGGTRAAALSYGVLEELARTEVGPASRKHRLLDEIDVISSVSGGSVTAAAYAAHGDRVFRELEPAFLKRNVQRTLIRLTLSPLNWFRLSAGDFGRTDIAADYYDSILFHGVTYGDLAGRPGPFVIVNATDISTGARFEFTQSQFDFICSDLSSFPLARAVAASSAVPAVLTPVTLHNYSGTCGHTEPEWVEIAVHRKDLTSRRATSHARELRSYLDRTNRPFLHLVDGGVADNLGLRALLDRLMTIEQAPEMSRHLGLERVRLVVFLVVDAHAQPEKKWDQRRTPPGILELALAGATIPITRYSYETIELLQEQIEHWRGLNQRRLDDGGHQGVGDSGITILSLVVRFEDIPDPQERRYFQNLPTSFHLSDRAVDRLRGVAGVLLRDNPYYSELLEEVSRCNAAP